MTERDVAAVVRGIAPVLKERMEQATASLWRRIRELEREVQELQDEATKP